MNFSDAIVAIAITLLVLPLADSASTIGQSTLLQFVHHHNGELVAFGLSFIVIWNFWWVQHQMLEHVVAYSRPLVIGLFMWTLSIVFLPFPTELLSSADKAGAGVHALYCGGHAGVQHGGPVRAVGHHPGTRTAGAGSSWGRPPSWTRWSKRCLMGVILVLVVVAPEAGLWWLLLLLLYRPLTRFVGSRRRPAVPAG